MKDPLIVDELVFVKWECMCLYTINAYDIWWYKWRHVEWYEYANWYL